MQTYHHLPYLRLLFLPLLFMFMGCVTNWELPDTPDNPESIDLLSLNIHYLVPERDRTNWEERKYAVTKMLETANPDIVLFQEMETFRWRGEGEDANVPIDNIQLDWVTQTVPGYTAGAVGDPAVFPITQPILYRNSRFELRRQGFFFFSETPDQIYALPWYGRWPSFTVWVHLLDRQTGRDFIILNTHMDAFSLGNRTNGIKLILDKIDEVGSDMPVIIAGDFNMLTADPLMQHLVNNDFKRIPMGGSSFHFGIGLHIYSAIDHFYISSNWMVEDGGVLQEKWTIPNNGGTDSEEVSETAVWSSDHHPIFTRVILQ